MGEQTVILEGVATWKQHHFLMVCNYLLSQGLAGKSTSKEQKKGSML